MEDRLVTVLDFVAGNEGASLAKACKRLGLSRSELLRCLGVLGDAPALGGLALVDTVDDHGRPCLRLSVRGRTWRAQQP